jgi:hypothetical protein
MEEGTVIAVPFPFLSNCVKPEGLR